MGAPPWFTLPLLVISPAADPQLERPAVQVGQLVAAVLPERHHDGVGQVRRPLARIVPDTRTSTCRNVGAVNATANGASSDNGETVASGGVDMGLTSTEPRQHAPRQRLYPSVTTTKGPKSSHK